jgi:hypothetical protein
VPRISRNLRVEHLIVARGSDYSDLPLLEGMIYQTVERIDVPGRDRILKLGIDPVRNPTDFGAEVIDKGGSTAVLFSVEGTLCLYSRGSAAKDETDEGDNGFRDILTAIINDYKPVNIYVATFSRLVRSLRHSSGIQAAIESAQSTLHYGYGESLNFNNQSAPFQWGMLVAFATMERVEQVNRLMLDRVGKHRQHKWLSGPQNVPMGYIVDRDNHITIDTRPGVAVAVHKVIRLMCDPSISYREIALAAGAIGVNAPGKRRGEVWTYNPDWEWDGTPYVPAAQRSPEDAIAVMPRAPGSNKGSIKTLSDYATPESIGKRLVETLPTWTSGVIHSAYANPLPNITHYAEYPVRLDPDGIHRVHFNYEPGVPDGGWADPDTLALAQAVRGGGRGATQPAHTRRKQLPLLGDLGRWNAGGYRHGLLGASSGTRRYYDLRRIPLPAEPRLDSHGRIKWPAFQYQKRTYGERTARLHVRELHTAITEALTRALTEGVTLTPDRFHPPSAIDPVGEANLHELQARRRELEQRSQAATNILLRDPDAPATVRRHLAHDLDSVLREVADLDAELEQAEATAGPIYPERLRTQPHEVAHALANLARVTRPTPQAFTKAVDTVLSDLRLEAHGAVVRGSVCANLPVEDGIVVVGPVEFTVPQRLRQTPPTRTDETAATTRAPGAEPERARDGKHGRTRAAAQDDGRSTTSQPGSEHPRTPRQAVISDTLRALLTTETAIGELATSNQRNGQGSYRDAVAELETLGLPRAGAQRALYCAAPTTRKVLAHLLTGEPAPPGVDYAFIERTDRTFHGAESDSAWWRRKAVHRAETAAFLREHNGQVERADLQRWLTERGASGRAFDTLSSGMREARYGAVPLTWPVFTTDPPPPGRCDPDCRRDCIDHQVVRLWPCPCGGLADHYIPVAEIRTGLLCSSCLREPNNDPTIYPADYLDITTERARERQQQVNPRLANRSQLLEVTRPIRARAREWAVETGLRSNDRTHLSDAHLVAYLDAIAAGEVQDNMAIREWALESGLTKSSRGPLPEHVITAYRLDLAQRLPLTALKWARANGYRLARNETHLPDAIAQAFAPHPGSSPATLTKWQPRHEQRLPGLQGTNTARTTTQDSPASGPSPNQLETRNEENLARWFGYDRQPPITNTWTTHLPRLRPATPPPKDHCTSTGSSTNPTARTCRPGPSSTRVTWPASSTTGSPCSQSASRTRRTQTCDPCLPTSPTPRPTNSPSPPSSK